MVKAKTQILKKWIKMISGKSVLHVKQGIGKEFDRNQIKGYYNDFTLKVSSLTNLDENNIPINSRADGEKVYFPIAIFQYGLACYDLFLETNHELYKKRFINIANWALENQDSCGKWNTFGYVGGNGIKEQSSMAQGEGASLLARAYIETKFESYKYAAQKAIDFMLIDINNNGTTRYDEDNIYFEEFVSEDSPTVLNGWIFSIFGLYDIYLLTKDNKYKVILEKTLDTLINTLHKYDCKFWSNYDLKGKIASPFYHELHIALLEALYILFSREEFKYYKDKWTAYKNNRLNYSLAFCIKAKQKLSDTNNLTIVG